MTNQRFDLTEAEIDFIRRSIELFELNTELTETQEFILISLEAKGLL